MKVDAKTNRISLEARLLQAEGRSPGLPGAGPGVGESVSALTEVATPVALIDIVAGGLEVQDANGFARLKRGPAGGRRVGERRSGNLPRCNGNRAARVCGARGG